MYVYILYIVKGNFNYQFVKECKTVEEAKEKAKGVIGWSTSNNDITDNFWVRGWGVDGFTSYVIAREYK